ncbi:MAG: Ribosomal RNA small subunit methyltransferase I [Alphaproteobacteria bacterium MarineAlpha9_Bin2]|nr:MAG: Ribosomal RNA small subunit methyltransferase I [Alphaproteobacteria bacterium MarineAlpha9_Bin2]
MEFGNLYIIATPIGNKDDITLRAIKTLKDLDFISCEDTRITAKLCYIHDIVCKGKLIPYHEHNSYKMLPKIIKKLKEGLNVGFVSDAGTPLISDPGFKLVKAALENNIIVKSIPGPSAVTAAISIAGISSDQFSFMGFLPKKKSLRIKKIELMLNLNSSIIIFEAPRRILNTLSEIYSILGNRNVSVIREITKIYEENINGKINYVLDKIKNKNIKGELVVLIEKKEKKEIIMDKNKIISMLNKKIPKLGVSAASKEISKKTLLKRDNIYKLALEIKNVNKKND